MTKSIVHIENDGHNLLLTLPALLTVDPITSGDPCSWDQDAGKYRMEMTEIGLAVRHVAETTAYLGFVSVKHGNILVVDLPRTGKPEGLRRLMRTLEEYLGELELRAPKGLLDELNLTAPAR